MKFYVNYTSLRRAVQKVSQFSAKKSTLPFTKSIYIGKFDHKEGQIELACTDIESIGQMNLEVEFEGDDFTPFSVNVRTLKQILAAVRPDKDGNVSLTTLISDGRNSGPDEVKIIGDMGHVNIHCDFSDVTKDLAEFIGHGLDQYSGVEPILTEGLLSAIKSVSFCASADEARPVLQGVRINGSVAATDGFRIGRNPEIFEGMDCIVPGSMITKASRLLGKSIFVKKKGDTLLLTDDNADVACRLIDGNFPDWQAIYPKSWWMKSVVRKEFLTEALSLAQASQKVFGGNNVIKLSFNDSDSLIVTTEIEGEGSCATHLNVHTLVNKETEFKLPFMIAANVRMMKEIVDHVAGDHVLLKCQKDNTPIVVESQEPDQAAYVLMPMHLG